MAFLFSVATGPSPRETTYRIVLNGEKRAGRSMPTNGPPRAELSHLGRLLGLLHLDAPLPCSIDESIEVATGRGATTMHASN